ncbi:hypothetical protein [Zobellella maritima]|uniref:hypothetical protein n=1 Tax=Zobellella maritima TaxID=2059725 RepID=UPI000E3097C4|nr:hypothetical protein [Zobellella maritima]
MIRRINWYFELSGNELDRLEVMVDFAATQGAGLRTVFVEDENLLRCGELPCSREISMMTGRVRPLSRQQLEGQLRRRRELVERRLEALARRRTLEWSREVIRGRRDQLLIAGTEDDIAALLLNEAAEPLPAWLAILRRPLLLLSSRFRPVNQLLIVCDNPSDVELLTQARELAGQQHWPLWVLVPTARVKELMPILRREELDTAMLPLGHWSLSAWLAAGTDRASLLMVRADSPVLVGASSRGINAALLLPAVKGGSAK